jgi:hypothetical protein
MEQALATHVVDIDALKSFNTPATILRPFNGYIGTTV